MPRQRHDPDRVRRCAEMYIAGDLDMAGAVERSGASRSAVWWHVKRLRDKTSDNQPQNVGD